MKNKKKIYIIAFLVFMLDQISKLLVRNNIELYQEIKLIPNFLSFYYVRNTGAAFSIFENSKIFLILISIFCLFFLIKIIHDEDLPINTYLFLGLLLGGILGNLLDRILFGYVIDFISVFIFKYSFPVFNIADICICISTFCLIFVLLEKNKKI